jgi:hypothetical protein
MDWAEVSVDEIKERAKNLYQEGKSWHFHILTPKCQLNSSDRFAFVLENATEGEVFVVYTESPLMNLGKELVKFLHGDVVDKEREKSKETKISEEAKKIVDRAQKLTNQGKPWHHHMLFPDCIFNDSGKWMVIFEDQEKGKILRSTTDEEPKNDLKAIETLYYQQKTLK